ncbi:PadR family transcriptional regulator [Alloscardovia theropitheci]|uniref:PadR family transcriptional regulator n=1 Tax=Alloscardovia theropitheci TaxID=2496842 RepID=A0A4R0QW02_9BIFI|nr:PadR family transcriptional regulator [Alloscardovia theropitheci]TCD53650.1 PadR family transcriptional regulator [Alloscardovia theropitheci]
MQGRDIVLGILGESKRTGYEINDILKNRLSYFFDGTYGMIYPTLRKLESEGMISKEVIVQVGKPNKNLYSLTEQGREELHAYLESDVDDEIFKSDFLMRLFFGYDLDDDKLTRLLEREIERKDEKIQTLTDNLRIWKENGLTRTQEMTIEYGLAQYDATKKVLEKQLKELKS